MKIEKISDNQVKILLNHLDLYERDIKLTELAFGTDKVQSLFRDMMEQALLECGFHADNTPLMIEAVPIPTEGIMIIVTKVTGVAENDELLHTVKDKERERHGNVIDFSSVKGNKNEDTTIFSFDSLDDAAKVSGRLDGLFSGSSYLFKDKNKYLLLLENDEDESYLSSEELDSILNEYGQKQPCTTITKYFFYEHYELLVNSPAIEALVNII